MLNGGCIKGRHKMCSSHRTERPRRQFSSASFSKLVHERTMTNSNSRATWMILSDESELINRVRDQDEDAFAKLFAHYRPRLLKVVKFRLNRRLQGRVDEEDILQDAYLAGAQRMSAYFEMADHPAFFLWLRLIVQQTLIDVHREHLGVQKRDAGREEQLGKYLGDNTSDSLSFRLIAQLASPSHVVEQAELAAMVEKAIEQLRPKDREILALRHFEELKNGEVAELLQLDKKAASIRYRRALARLYEVLEGIPGVLDEKE